MTAYVVSCPATSCHSTMTIGTSLLRTSWVCNTDTTKAALTHLKYPINTREIYSSHKAPIFQNENSLVSPSSPKTHNEGRKSPKGFSKGCCLEALPCVMQSFRFIDQNRRRRNPMMQAEKTTQYQSQRTIVYTNSRNVVSIL